MTLTDVIKKAESGKRLTLDEGVRLFDAELIALGEIAEKRKRKFHPEPVVTFVIDRNITFTNVCVSECRFCAFFEKPGSERAFVLSDDEILSKIEELVKIGGTQVMLQGGLNPALGLVYYENLLRKIKSRFAVHIHSFSAAEIVFLSKKESLTVREVVKRLKEAGLDSLPGAAEILVDQVRSVVSPAKASSAEWLDVMKTAHTLGLHTTATMTFGMVETKADRVEHLIKIRELQDETGGVKGFIPWTFSPRKTKLDHVKPAGGADYLKTLAISRIILDNIPNIHAGWVTEGEKLAQIGLTFGANDLGGILMDEVVVKATGVENKMSFEKIVRVIKSAGMIPAQRNSRYEIIRRF